MVSTLLKESEIKGGVIGGRLSMNSISESMSGASGNTSFKDMWKDWNTRLNKYKTIVTI
jgi:hypothetical protein